MYDPEYYESNYGGGIQEAIKVLTVFVLWFCLIGLGLRAAFHEPDIGRMIGEEFGAQGMVIRPPPKVDECLGTLDFEHNWRGCA